MSERKEMSSWVFDIINWLDADGLVAASYERKVRPNTAMGFDDPIVGHAMTHGWVVMLRWEDRTEVWHVSAWGTARLRSSEAARGE